jgi:hypothetical protein
MIDTTHLLPQGENERNPSPIAVAAPSAKRQSWGAVISIVIIVAMVVIGAFYAWGKRIAEERALYGTAAEAL